MVDIGLEHMRFHDLHHTYAVASDDVKTVQENLGHHTSALTLDICGHVSEKMKTQSVARMDKFITELKGILKGTL